MDFDKEYRLLCSHQVRSHEDAGPDCRQMIEEEMIEEEKDQEISDEEENMSQKTSSSYSKLRGGESKIIIKGASVSALGPCSGSGPVRVCDFCGKKFNSGKALGGHRRYHIQVLKKMETQNQTQQQQEKVNYTLRIKSKDLVIRDNDNNNLIKSNIGNLNSSSCRHFRCPVCDKDFPSKKSLYGHMRSHSDRNWRGMDPPFTTTDNALASSEEFMKVQDDGSSSSASEESLSVPVDVSSSCSESWLKKDMRGRKSIGEAEEAHIAAQTLMRMHLYGNSHLRDRLPPQDEPTPEAAALLPVKKRKKNVTKNHDCKDRDGNEELEAQNNMWDMKVISIVKEKKLNNKKMKLGSEMIKSEGEPLMIRTVKQEEVKPSQGYVCDICNKSFPCFQALGGHKTKHRKNIVKSTKGKEVVQQRQEEEKVEEEDNKICINGSLLSTAGLSGEEGTVLISSEERLAKNSNDTENNSNEEEVAEARQQSGSKIRDFDLNVPYVLEHEATDL